MWGWLARLNSLLPLWGTQNTSSSHSNYITPRHFAVLIFLPDGHYGISLTWWASPYSLGLGSLGFSLGVPAPDLHSSGPSFSWG